MSWWRRRKEPLGAAPQEIWVYIFGHDGGLLAKRPVTLFPVGDMDGHFSVDDVHMPGVEPEDIAFMEIEDAAGDRHPVNLDFGEDA